MSSESDAIKAFETTVTSLTAKVDGLAKQLKANDEEDKMASAKRASKKAGLVAALAGIDAAQKATILATVKAGGDDEMKAIVAEYEEENKDEMAKAKSKTAKETTEDPVTADAEKEALKAKNKALLASLTLYETERKTGIIDELIALKASLIPDLDKDIYKISLQAKKFEELHTAYQERKDEIEAMKAAVQSQKEGAKNKVHFGFPGQQSSLSASETKMSSLNDMMKDGGVY